MRALIQELWANHPGKTVGVGFGLLLGILFLLVGFWRMLVFALLVLAGYWIGRRIDRQEDMYGLLSRILPDDFFRRH